MRLLGEERSTRIEGRSVHRLFSRSLGGACYFVRRWGAEAFLSTTLPARAIDDQILFNPALARAFRQDAHRPACPGHGTTAARRVRLRHLAARQLCPRHLETEEGIEPASPGGTSNGPDCTGHGILAEGRGSIVKRTKILFGMALGALWAVAVVVLPGLGPQPFVPLNLALVYAFLPGGLFLILVIGRLAQRRFFDDAIIDGEPFALGSGAEIDQRVLTNTVEQMLLALLIWPFAASWLGGQTVIVMGVAMAVARLAFWIGYHLSPPLRAFGFAASFYPTILAVVWTLWKLLG